MYVAWSCLSKSEDIEGVVSLLPSTMWSQVIKGGSKNFYLQTHLTGP